MRIIISVFVLLIGLQAHSATINLKMATEGAFHPWNFCYDLSGNINNACTNVDIANGHILAGFDVDLGNSLCAKMSEIDTVNTYNCTWTVEPWSKLSVGTGLGTGLGTDYDLVIAQMVANDSRKAFADFVGPYMFRPEIKFISLVNTSVSMGGATKVNPRTDSLGNTILDCPTNTNLTLGLQENTTHYNHVTTYCTSPVITYTTQSDADAALLSGSVDMTINLTSAASSMLTGSSPLAKAHGNSLEYPGSSAPSLAFDKTASNANVKAVAGNAIFSLYSLGVIRVLQDIWE